MNREDAVGLDPGAETLIALSRAAGRPPIEEMDVEAAREAVRAGAPRLGGDPAHMHEVHDFQIPVDGRGIGARLYTPVSVADDPAAPALVFLHGGGWMVGDLETHDRLCRLIARAGDCRIVAVDYRRAPEHKFPSGLEDAAAATRWVMHSATTLGIDASRVGVAGDSSGGNLAAVVALMSNSWAGPRLSLQALFYPVCDLSMTSQSYDTNGSDYLLTRSGMAFVINAYLRGPDDRHDWRASPLAAPSLAGAPPALVLTAGFDPLRDEGQAFAARLGREGVQVEHLHIAGQIHGFLTASGIVPEALSAIEKIGAFLKREWRR